MTNLRDSARGDFLGTNLTTGGRLYYVQRRDASDPYLSLRSRAVVDAACNRISGACVQHEKGIKRPTVSVDPLVTNLLNKISKGKHVLNFDKGERSSRRAIRRTPFFSFRAAK
jgi:hypothetical protein